jgi:dolichol-phosphate mannosyltransferase
VAPARSSALRSGPTLVAASEAGIEPPSHLRTLVVIPTYQERDNIEVVLCGVRHEAPAADVLIVDDHSPDGTAALAEQLGAELGQISVLNRPRKNGFGAACRAGFAYGLQRGYELLIQMDADLSHDPKALPGLIARMNEGADLVIGSRYIPGGSIPSWSARRRALSRYGNRYASLVLGLRASDATSGLRAYRADALRAVDYESTRATGYAFQIEMAYRMARWGGRLAEVPIVFTDRVRGQSKMSARIAAEAMILVTWWGLRDRVFRAGLRGERPQGA